jgi:hypothetical protein
VGRRVRFVVVSDELCGVEELLAGAGGALDGLRHEAKRLEESLALVRERIKAGEAVLSAVAAWRSIAQDAMVSPSPSPSPSVAGSVGVSRADQVVGLLAQDPSRVWRAEDVAAVLGVQNPESLRNTLCRLVNVGRLVRPGSGAYRVAR